MGGVTSALMVWRCGRGVGKLLCRCCLAPAEPGGPPSPNERVRLIVFDFDQTLSVIHVFKTLAGWPGGEDMLCSVGPASTELGQLRLVDAIGPTRTGDAADFPTSSFGGSERIQRLREVLSSIRDRQTRMCICTKGLVGPVQKILKSMGLREFFEEVYGLTDDQYGVLPYDEEQKQRATSAEEAQLLAKPEQADWGLKRELIDTLMEQSNLKFHQVLFVEDDENEIHEAFDACRTLLVAERTGMKEEHLRELLKLTEVAPHDGRGGSSATLLRQDSNPFIRMESTGSTRSDIMGKIPSKAVMHVR